MIKQALKYKECVVQYLMAKYGFSEMKAEQAIRKTYLYDLLKKYPMDIIHGAVETHGDNVYYDYAYPERMEL